ncbi:MAG: ABC transporter permease subunit, partial [Natronosporangium sp.]
MAVATIGIAVLVAATGSLQPDDSIVAASLGNAVPGQIAAGVLGALVVCGEYSSGTIRATLAACPRRLTVLTAKTLVVAALVFVVALAATVVAYLAGAVLLSGQGHLSLPRFAGDFQTRFDLVNRGRKSSCLLPRSTPTSCV